MDNIEKKYADNDSAYIQGMITKEQYEKNKLDIDKILEENHDKERNIEDTSSD